MFNHLIFSLIFLQYTFLLVLVFLLEAIIGGLAYFYETQLEDELKRTLNTTFSSSYGIDEKRTIAIDRMQQEVKSIKIHSLKCQTMSIFYSTNVVVPFVSKIGEPVNGFHPIEQISFDRQMVELYPIPVVLPKRRIVDFEIIRAIFPIR